MDPQTLLDKARSLTEQAAALAKEAESLSAEAVRLAQRATEQTGGGVDPTIIGLTVFVLACFVGYYVVWKVTPALHSPLMSVTNAVSSVIIVGALIAAGPAGWNFAKVMGFLAVTLASVNIFGGFIVTQRMLQMFKKKN
ncbi:MAG: proton-translocating transhydrogenase family protein [Alphaproteobacteria bacterium]|nr:proton-translocating transhydrogenase family protein [Alphaproteobacteria bacterium]